MRKGLGLFGLEGRRLRENVINKSILKGGNKEGKALRSSAQWQEQSQGAQTQGDSLNMRNGGVNKHWTQITLGGCAVSLFAYISKPSSDGPGKTCHR